MCVHMQINDMIIQSNDRRRKAGGREQGGKGAGG